MKKIFAALFLLAMTSVGLFAQIPDGYYNNATGKTGDELKIALHDIIKDHHVVSYSGLLNAFAYTDCKPNGKIWDIYSNIEYSINSNLCGIYESEGDCWNREHTWPQNWFNESSIPRSDLFHVYPTDGYVNGMRSSYPYGEVNNNPVYVSGNGSKLGPCATSGYSGRVFEPIDEYKGDIARSYFYMSVRYFGEDDEWSTSGMTNKSEILPWAMTMLLRWSDEDTVSQKEIDRNNAVYGYQYNRNPFIDHPEYAHMIWDENWQGGVYYNITCATGLSHGSVSAPESAMEGTTVSIAAVPEPGYMVNSYSVYKTGSPNTTVTVSSNGTFTMPAYAVTVSATFVENNNYYDITLGTVSHGTINASETSAKSGMTINLTATPNGGYSLYSWYVFKTGDMNTTVNVSGNSFVMPAFNVTVMATFVQGTVSTGDYVKVTSEPSDWSGEYLIVYEGGNVAFNGGLTSLDAVSNTIPVSISSNTIVANATTDAARFTLAAMSGGYSIKSASGYYIGQTSNANGMATNASTRYANTIAYNNGDVGIVSSGAYLRYNSLSGQTRFRYYKSSSYTSQKAIQLYKKSAPTAAPTHTIHFNSNDGEGIMIDQTVNEFEPTALQDNVFEREGYVFEGWNTAADGTGDYYADGATVNLLDDLTLYAQWNQLFSITLAEVSHGSISADASQAFAESEIILTATPDPCYALIQWLVTDEQGNTVNVIENTFEMPASNVIVSAVFAYSPQSFVQEYQLVTSDDQLVAGRTYLIVNVANGEALGTTQNANNRSAAAVTIEDNIISTIDNTVCELTLGAVGNNWTFFDASYGNNGGYLCAASSSNNYLRTQTTNNANGQWSIAIGANGVATIQAQGLYSRNLLKYNKSSDIFACYASENNQLDVYLFRRTELADYPIDQAFEFEADWNWWSTPIEIDLQQLETALGTNGIRILAQNGNSTINSNHGWSAGLASIDVGKMYMIKTQSACSFTLNGAGVNPAQYPITLNPGVNWIGFVGNESLPINEALSDLSPANLDNIKSDKGSATYYQGLGWRGSISTLIPGKGYIYKSNATTSKTFRYPTR